MLDQAEYVGIGLDAKSFDNDRAVAARIGQLANVTYLSLLDHLCHDSPQPECLARVPGEGPLDLMAVDFGHFSPKGSAHLGRALWKPYFDRTLR